jgi:hypothetical protein
MTSGVAIRLHPSRAESLSVLDRGDEGLDHLGIDVIAVELIQFCQPEVVTGVIDNWQGPGILTPLTAK